MNPKCPICKCYIKNPELKSSGEPYKSCKRCRDIQRKNRVNKADEPDDKKDEYDTINIKGIEYEVKSKILDKDMARKLIPDFDTKYEDIEDIPDENVVIPDNCFKYVLGAKMDNKMMEELGIRITSGDDEDNNIYPDDDDNKILEDIKKKSPVFIPDSESD